MNPESAIFFVCLALLAWALARHRRARREARRRAIRQARRCGRR